MLTVLVFLPLLATLALLIVSRVDPRLVRWSWIGVAALEVAIVVGMWFAYDAPRLGHLAFDQQVRWIPSVGSSYHVGVDGLSLPLLALTAVVFLACAIFARPGERDLRTLAALFCAMETTCLGLFAAQDLILFFVFFDLSLVAMYFVIAGWGHGDNARSALRFFLYTFLGSLALLLGFIGLYLGAEPHTFDMVALANAPSLQGQPAAAMWVLVAIVIGLAVKTPTVPFHTWLPPAHTDAPSIGSAVLAGVMLKMGTYGFVRIAMPMLPDAWRDAAWVLVAIGIVSVLYGALVALAQTDLKRMIAYTSVNHMGYVVLAVGAAGLVGDNDADARRLAVAGATTQMVSHGLITAALFLLAGILHRRADTYEIAAFGGLGHVAPRFAVLLSVGAFASLGLPAFSGFIAEFQIFTGSIAVAPVTALALLGILITAALFLRALQQLLTGTTRVPGENDFADLRAAEALPVALLLALSLAIGIAPAWLLDVIEPAAATVIDQVGR